MSENGDEDQFIDDEGNNAENGDAAEGDGEDQAEKGEVDVNDPDDGEPKESNRSPYSNDRFGKYAKDRMLEMNLFPFYGRTKELDQLEAAVARISPEDTEHQCEAIWICGDAGVGKSTLIEEATYEIFEAKSNLVCQGTGEENHVAALPLQTLSDCLGDLCERLEQHGGKELWQPRIDEALGGEASLLIGAVPALRKFIDAEPIDTRRLIMFDINSRRRFDRLTFAIRDFLKAILAHHPIVMIIDNIHWADLDSLEIIYRLVTSCNLERFLLVGCHEPVDDAHPLATHKAAISGTDIQETHINLQPFDLDSTKEVLSGLLLDAVTIDEEKPVQRTEDLAKTLHKCTRGNALWMMAILRILNDESILVYDKGEFKWSKQAVKKHMKQWKEDGNKVVKSISGAIENRIENCSKKIRFVLEAIALLRLTTFSLEKLDKVLLAAWTRQDKECYVQTEDDLKDFLSKACKLGFVEDRGEGYFRFSHDCVRSSAYSTAMTEETKTPETSMHLAMAKELNLISAKEKPDSRFKFLAIDQLNCCSSLLPQGAIVKLYKLNQEVAEICITRTSFRTAAEFLEITMGLIDNETKWKHLYDVTLRNFLYLARMKVCCNDLEASKKLCKDIFKYATSLKDKIYASHLMFSVLMEEGKYNDALNRALALLGRMGENFPSENLRPIVDGEVGKLRQMVAQRDNRQLLNPPKMTDGKALDINFLLALVVEISDKCEPNYYKLFAMIRMMHLSLRFGHSRQYPLAFALFGSHLVTIGAIKEGHRYGQVAEKLGRGTDLYGGKAAMMFQWNICHWRRHYRRSLEPILNIYNDQVDNGDFENADFSIVTYIQYHLASGFELEGLRANVMFFERPFYDYDMPDKWRITIVQELITNLMGETESPLVFFGDDVSEEDEFIAELESGGDAKAALDYFYFMQLFIASLFNDADMVQLCLSKIQRPPDGIWSSYYYFFESLFLISKLPTTKGRGRNDLKAKIEEKKGKLIDWYNAGAPNPSAMISLLDAEYLVNKEAGRQIAIIKVQEVYDEAIHAAAKEGMLHLEALASEKAGMYFDSIGKIDEGARYLRRAHKKYIEWKGVAKVIDIEERFADILHIRHRYQVVPRENYFEHQKGKKKGVKKIAKLAGKGTKKIVKGAGKGTKKAVKGLFSKKDKGRHEVSADQGGGEEEQYAEDDAYDGGSQGQQNQDIYEDDVGEEEYDEGEDQPKEKKKSKKLFGKLKKIGLGKGK
ncbi:unnamed protein product [Cylindrotheca closterium]|uniref:Orc1-like AAA ATPase domain-containing protein n=1 Tax=Cylindrotheca closterium TaxID=2856 RepID=A0AAD2FWU8_9STRA|nr:unnamed protein product [Cylindrotheca closterium]